MPLEFKVLKTFALLFTLIFFIAFNYSSAADLDCGDDPDVCVGNDTRYTFTLSLQAFGFFQTGSGQDIRENGNNEIIFTGNTNGGGGIPGATCQILFHGNSAALHGDFNPNGVDSGTRLFDVLKNFTEAGLGYGANLTSSIPGHGSVSLGDLFGPNSSNTVVVALNLSGETGQTRMRIFGSNSRPSQANIILDLNEINSQASSVSGNSSRELGLTLLHELTHAYIDSVENQSGIDPNTTTEDETDLDDFAANLLNQLEVLADNLGINPYSARTCND